MAKKGNFLGGIFDFNRDGSTSFTERVIGYDIATNIPDSGSYSDYDSFSDDKDMYDEFGIDSDDWRYEAEDNPVKGVDPWDYNSEEEYLYAVEDMVNSNHSGNSEPIDLNNAYIKITLKTDEEIAADKIREQKEYEEMRKDPIRSRRYDAQEALDMAEIGHFEYLIPNIELYKFILESPCIAAKYLYDYGEFCYLEAVIDNFDIPEDVLNHPDSTSLPGLIWTLSETEPEFAANIWLWCIKEFGPYKKYSHSLDNDLYDYMLPSYSAVPEAFADIVIDSFINDAFFRNCVINNYNGFPYSLSGYIARILDDGHASVAAEMFSLAVHKKKADTDSIKIFAEDILDDCDGYRYVEIFDDFKEHLLPVIRNLNLENICEAYEATVKELEQQIVWYEDEDERYQYTRKYAWRAAYINNDYGIDPLDYSSKEEFLKEINDSKYSWRKDYAVLYDIYPENYETETAFKEALATEVARRKTDSKPYNQNNNSAFVPSGFSWENTSDKTTYTFVGIKFSQGGQIFFYLYDGTDIDVGDKIVVPVGYENKDKIVEVVTVQRHRRLTAPFPVDRTKKAKRKYIEET